MAATDVLLTAMSGLWAAFVVFRLETLRDNHQEIRQRLIRVEHQVRPEDE